MFRTRSLYLTLGLLSAGISESRAALLTSVQDASLITYDWSAPGVILSSTPVSGLDPADPVFNLTLDPLNQSYLGITLALEIYRISPDGVAQNLGTFNPAPSGFAGGFAYDNINDVFLYASEAGEQFTLTRNGSVTQGSAFAFEAGDPNQGSTPVIAAAAFDPDFGTAFFLDSDSDSLLFNYSVVLGELTTGPSLTLGGSPFDFTSFAGLAVDPDGNLLASLDDGNGSRLFQVDPATGALSELGALPSGATSLSFAAAPVPEPAGAALLLLSGLAFVTKRRRASAS